jgi:hypothetical protein
VMLEKRGRSRGADRRAAVLGTIGRLYKQGTWSPCGSDATASGIGVHSAKRTTVYCGDG